MIVKDIAIPLDYHPYSSTSRVVHWLTRHNGKISTLLKGALRPKSPFLGEYELFSTSELLYLTKRTGSLYVAKECALLKARTNFRTDWRSTLAASHINVLISRNTPDETPLEGLFEFYEDLLDQTVEHGHQPTFLYWAELKTCDYFGHTPQLNKCIRCSATNRLRFSAASGGTVCTTCARKDKIPTLESPPDVLAILRRFQNASTPDSNVKLSDQQKKQLDAIMELLTAHHLNTPPQLRRSAFAA